MANKVSRIFRPNYWKKKQLQEERRIEYEVQREDVGIQAQVERELDLVNTEKQTRDNEAITAGCSCNQAVVQNLIVENELLKKLLMQREVEETLNLLAKYSNPHAEINSASRHPLPRCLPGTRTQLLTAAKQWLMDSQRKTNTFWLHGPAGVGKSAVAQTVAEYARDNEMLGGVFFLSDVNDRNDPCTIFPTIARQIAEVNDNYRREVGKILASTPLLPHLDLATQLENLIVKPFRQIHLDVTFVFVLDGLEECNGFDKQYELVNLITKFNQSPGGSLPILWMITSRTEHHLRILWEREDIQELWWIEEMAMDTQDAEEDTARYIRSEFTRIKRKYVMDVEDKDWPDEMRVRKIIDASSGYFAYASSIMRFIDDLNYSNPTAQLDTVMQMLRSQNQTVPDNSSGNPLEFLDALYNGIMNRIPKSILDEAKCILYAFYQLERTGYQLCLHDFFNYLGRDVYRPMSMLHSVLKIPPREEFQAVSSSLLPFHWSFFPFISKLPLPPLDDGLFRSVSNSVRSQVTSRAAFILNSPILLSAVEPTIPLWIDSSVLPSFNVPIGSESEHVGNIVEAAMHMLFHFTNPGAIRNFDFRKFIKLRLKRTLRLTPGRLLEITHLPDWRMIPTGGKPQPLPPLNREKFLDKNSRPPFVCAFIGDHDRKRAAVVVSSTNLKSTLRLLPLQGKSWVYDIDLSSKEGLEWDLEIIE